MHNNIARDIRILAGIAGAMVCGLGATSAWADPIEIELSAQGNVYAERDPNLRASGAASIEWHPYAREADGSTHNLDVVLFGRYAEGADAERKHTDIRELNYIFASGAYEARIGVSRQFWGVTESAHIVDIINQSDLLEDFDGEDKLGQPLLSFGRSLGDGRLTGFVMPRFRERAFGPVFQELAPFPIASKQAVYESARGAQHVDYAARFTQRFGDLDLGISGFWGTAREPRLLPCAGRGTGRPGTATQANCDLNSAFPAEQIDPVTGVLIDVQSLLGLGPSREELEQQYIADAMADVVMVPHYDQIVQFGLDAQWIAGAAAWKLEARYRQQQDEWQLAGVAGVEYSLGTYVNDLIDAGLLVEFLYDDRDLTQYLSLFEEDVFIGMRLLGNDAAGTQLLGGVIIDIDNTDQFWSLEASRRFGNNFRGAIELRAYEPGDDAQATDFLDDLDFIRLEFSYFL